MVTVVMAMLLRLLLLLYHRDALFNEASLRARVRLIQFTANARRRRAASLPDWVQRHPSAAQPSKQRSVLSNVVDRIYVRSSCTRRPPRSAAAVESPRAACSDDDNKNVISAELQSSLKRRSQLRFGRATTSCNSFLQKSIRGAVESQLNHHFNGINGSRRCRHVNRFINDSYLQLC